MNGYQSRILESHEAPGGLCTAWKRNGYVFDTSIHTLAASSSGRLHRMWEELGVVQGRRFVHHDPTLRIEIMGRQVDIPRDLGQLERVARSSNNCPL